MITKNPQGQKPQIDPSAYVSKEAIVIGNVKIGKNVFIGPLAVIRADEPNTSIEIKDNSNVQDHVAIHALKNSEVLIGENTSIAHSAIVHGPCIIGNNCFVGCGAVVFTASVADTVCIKHKAVVECVDITSHMLVDIAEVITKEEDLLKIKPIDEKAKHFMASVIKANLELVNGYKQ